MRIEWGDDGQLRILCVICLKPITAEDGWGVINEKHPSGTMLEFMHNNERCYLAYERQYGVQPDHHRDAVLAELVRGSGMTSRDVRAVEKFREETGVLGSVFVPKRQRRAAGGH